VLRHKLDDLLCARWPDAPKSLRVLGKQNPDAIQGLRTPNRPPTWNPSRLQKVKGFVV
jgi:hypothetical protein